MACDVLHAEQVASCERTCLPTGEAAAKVRSILKEQGSAEAAMRVVRMGSRTGSRPVRKSFGKLSACVPHVGFVFCLKDAWMHHK